MLLRQSASRWEVVFNYAQCHRARKHTNLKDAFADWRSFIGLVGSVQLSQLAACFQSAVVQSFKDLLVQQRSFGTVEK